MSTKPDFVLKVDDRLPELQAQLVNKKTRKPVADLTGTVVTFRFKLRGTSTWTSITPVTIVDGPKAIVSVAWGVGDTATAGDYDMEFKITFADTRVMSVPNEGCLLLRISDC
jgi:hypothetical protein